jgi:uncharacterized membrane protein
MSSSRYSIHRILRVLAWGVVGIFLAAAALLVIAFMMPLFFGTLLQSGAVSESAVRSARSLVASIGSLGSAMFNLIIALVVILILLAVGLAVLERKPLSGVRADEAYAALRLRYVKGEITKEQYLEMKKTLDKA